MTRKSYPTFCIIGVGRVGSILAYHFVKSNFSIKGIIEKDKEKHSTLRRYFPDIAISEAPTAKIISKSDIIFISVQDDQLSEAVYQLERLEGVFSGKTFVHTSGAYSSEALAPLRKRNGQIVSAHPIYSFGSSDLTEISLEGVYVDLEGDARALSELKTLFQEIGLNTIEISAEQKLAIHIASVLYSNYFVGLAQIAQHVLGASGILKEDHWEPFLPLIQSTLKNLSSTTPAEALTGPLKRGDIQTIRKHLRYLKLNLPEGLQVYAATANYILNHLTLPDEKKNLLKTVLDEHLK